MLIKTWSTKQTFSGENCSGGRGGTKQWKNLFDSCWVFLLLLFWGITVEPAVSESPELCCCFSGIVVQSGAPLKTHTKAKLQIQTSWLKSNTKEQKRPAKGYRPAKQTNRINRRRVGGERQVKMFYNAACQHRSRSADNFSIWSAAKP